MNQHKTKACFNKAYKSYDAHNHVQRHAGKTLLKHLSTVDHSFINVIDLGCGTGIMTEQLAQQITYQSFHAIDIADLLLTQAKNRLKHLNIKTQIANFDDLSFIQQPLDLMFANLSLQWSIDLEKTLSHLTSHLAPNGIIAFTIPLIETFKELKPYFSVNAFYTFNEIENLLEKSFLSLLDSRVEIKSEYFDSTLNALKSIKGVGANATSQSKVTSLRGRSSIPTNITSLTYHLGYFIARKKEIIAS